MKTIIMLFGVSLLIVLNTSCSMVGVMVGSAIDNPHTIYTPVEPFRGSLSTDREATGIAILKPGETIQVIKADGKEVKGRYLGIKVVKYEHCLAVRRGRRRTSFIPVSDAREILIVDTPAYGKTMGFILGAAVDVAILTGLSGGEFGPDLSGFEIIQL